jgi:hypothetical protein
LNANNAPLYLAVVSLVSAVDKLHKIGDKKRKSEAQEVLNRSLELARAIEEQLATLGTGEQHTGGERQVKGCDILNNSDNTAAGSGHLVRNTLRASIGTPPDDGALGCMSNLTCSESWTINDTITVQKQLPSHHSLLKVSAPTTLVAVLVCMDGCGLCVEDSLHSPLAQHALMQ